MLKKNAQEQPEERDKVLNVYRTSAQKVQVLFEEKEVGATGQNRKLLRNCEQKVCPKSHTSVWNILSG